MIKGARASWPRRVMRRAAAGRSIRCSRGVVARRGERQGEGEARAATEFALYGNLAAVRLYQMLDDGQAKPCAIRAPRARLVGAVQALEDARQILRGDADAGVFDVDGGAPVLGFCGDRQAAFGAVELDRVVNQVIENLFEPRAV